MDNFPSIDTKLGVLADKIVSFLDSTFEELFEFIFFVASRTINGIDAFLVAIPWFIFIIIIFLLGWYFQTILSGIMYAVFIFLIGTFGLWEDMMMTLSIIISSVFISLV